MGKFPIQRFIMTSFFASFANKLGLPVMRQVPKRRGIQPNHPGCAPGCVSTCTIRLHHHHYYHHLAPAVTEISHTIWHQTVLFAMAAGRSSTFIPVSLEMVSGKVSFLPVEAFQRGVRYNFTLCTECMPISIGIRSTATTQTVSFLLLHLIF